MYPLLFEYGRITIFTYGVLVACGFLAGLWVGERQAERFGIERRKFQDVTFVLLLGALAGARLFYVLLEWEQFVSNPLEIVALWRGGLVFYGGFIGAGLAILWYARARGLPVWSLGDAIAPGLALGQAFGRLGCFFAGCCYGAPCDLPWAVRFQHPRGLVPPERWGVPLHPTQLYEALANLVLFGLLWGLAKHRRFPGQVFGAYLAAYPLVRFVLEFFRADPRGAWGPLSTSQILGIPLFVFGIWTLFGRGHTREA